MIGEGVSEQLREQINHAAGGNPLFISEMLAMVDGNEQVEVPPTLKALLAARLDQLDEPERRLLERGAVEGEIFHRGSVQALTPEETEVTTRLATLVRHQLLRPDRAQLAGDDAYRFRHLLIRDAAYDALPKAVRADLHARFADWLDEHGQALVELDEIVGYHLEQAVRYLSELGHPDAGLADRAAARLAAAGRRASDREDPTASALLDRAARLVRPHRLDLALELEAAWGWSEEDVRAAIGAANAAAERAEAAGDSSGAMLARAAALSIGTFTGDVGTTDEIVALCHAALPDEEEDGDPRRLAILWAILAHTANFRMQNAEDVDATLRSLRYSRLAGDKPTAMHLAWALILSPRPIEEAMRMLAEVDGARLSGATDLRRAVLLAMLGRFDEAWPLAEARSSHVREISGDGAQDGHSYLWLIATIEGDRERACRHCSGVIRVLDTHESASVAAAFRSFQARDLCHLARFDEAESVLTQVRSVPPRATVRVMAPSVEALLLAGRGKLQQAEARSRAAVARAETDTDNIWYQAWTNEDLATVLKRAGRIDEAQDALGQALAHWERKGCLPCAQRLREQIASLGPTKQ
jgi:tetratricopeptide (TPR) repeat protein